MTTIVAPDIEEHSEKEQWGIRDRAPADTTREEPDHPSSDPTQGRKIGSEPYDDPTRGR